MSKFTDYKFCFESTIAGIPCQIAVTDCDIVKGSYSYNAPSDMDYYGYEDIEWIVLDRKGYVANWLSKKTTSQDEDRIMTEIREMHSDRQSRYDYYD
jgi:hypothetical protein